jgi:uncharacterized membrane protein YdbT with pleckstrin-like domain
LAKARGRGGLLYNDRLSQPKSSNPDPTIVVHPSKRLVRPIFTLAFALYALVFFYNNNRKDNSPVHALHAVPTIVLLLAVARNIKRRFTTITIGSAKLRYESGLLSKTTRTMDLVRIQDVRVDQTLVQRMLGIGNIAVETAGETSRISMENIDNPQGVADFILESARK